MSNYHVNSMGSRTIRSSKSEKVLDSFNGDGDMSINRVSKNKSGSILRTSTANGNIFALSVLKEIPYVESTLSGC